MKRWRFAVALLVLASTLLAAWNLADEYYILASWRLVFYFLLAWMVGPCICGLAGLLSSRKAIVKTAQILLVAHGILFLVYALNGSTQERGEGAQHMHLLFVPFLSILGSSFMLAVAYLIGKHCQKGGEAPG